MKKFIPMLVAILVSLNAIGQNPYYDALALTKLEPEPFEGKLYFATENRMPAAKILKKYASGDQYGEIEGEFQTNPFFSLSQNSLQSESPVEGQEGKSLTSAISGFNVSTVADGLAKFLVSRTKQELSITFFTKFKSKMDSIPELKILFPKTFEILKVIDRDIYQFSNYLATLREAFDDDLQDTLENLELLLKEKKEKRLISNKDDDIAKKIEYFQAALLIINSVRNGVHPADAVGKLENQTFMSSNEPMLNIQQGTKLFNIFSTSLKSRQSDRYWIDSDSLQLLMEPVTFRIYLGLLYQEKGDVEIFGKKFSQYLNEASTGDSDIQPYKDYVQHVINESEKISQSINRIKGLKDSGEKIRTYAELFGAAISIVKGLDELEGIDISLDHGESEKKVVQVMDIAKDLYLDVNERRYNALILDLSTLLTALNVGGDWKDNLLKYGTFIANVAKAENSDEVMSAIEAVALPVGSASIKRKTKSNISLNAYVGLSPGGEFSGETGTWKFVFGVHTPVGVAFSWGKNKNEGQVGKPAKDVSNSLFLSVVDITAFSTFRFNDSETDELPDVSLSNIFAPGLYYVHGVANLPVSWGIGGQLGPQLRGIDATAATTENGITFSGKFFIAIDIPLINFYTKSR